MIPKRCLVTGGTGAVGPSIVDRLVTEGFLVTVLCRKAPDAALFPGGVQIALGDISCPQRLAEVTRGKDVVVHLAAFLHVNDPGPDQLQEMRATNVEGTKRLVAAARENGVARFVQISTIAVYGYRAGELLSESTPPRPDTAYGQTKLEAERVALGFTLPDGTPASTVLRLAAVYGPRIKGNYLTLLSALAKGRFVPIGAGRNRRTMVHSDDVVEALMSVLERPDARGKVFNVTDGSHHELRDVIAEMCRALGRSHPRLVIPAAPVQVSVAIADRILSVMGRSPRLSSMLEKYLEEVLVDGCALRDLGYRPQKDLRLGWEQTVRQLRAEGKL